jgi:hypothetical protein
MRKCLIEKMYIRREFIQESNTLHSMCENKIFQRIDHPQQWI